MRWLGLATPRPGRIAIRTGNWYWGVERSELFIKGKPYMTRWIAYLGPIGFRLHKFFRGDDDGAPHDHPFWFITIPLGTDYVERVYGDDDVVFVGGGKREWYPSLAFVRAWVPHFRRSSYRHIVIGPYGGDKPPFWTFCIFGFTDPNWGFWPDPDTKINWKVWDQHNNRGIKLPEGGVL